MLLMMEKKLITKDISIILKQEKEKNILEMIVKKQVFFLNLVAY